MSEPVPEVIEAESDRGADAPPGQLWPLLVWAVVFCDIGTSIYYVPGILYHQIGNLTPLMVFATTIGFLLLASKYVEICWRNPEGGGVVSVTTKAFTPSWGALGGMLIIVDYFLTSAISTVSGIHYLGSIFGSLEQHLVLVAMVFLIFLAIINIIGIRESAYASLIMAIASFGINLVVIGMTFTHLDADAIAKLWEHVRFDGDLPLSTILIGFSGAWLAFSGLESISQLSPAMKQPIRGTASRGMWYVVITMVLTSPLLTLFSIALLPEMTKSADAERFISELGFMMGGFPIKIAVVLSASSLLLFAANTATIGGYHVFLALSKGGFFPGKLTERNQFFGTPHYAIILATIVPIAVIYFVHGDLVLLGEMYAFGLLGAFVLSSLGLDVIRWRENKRNWVFWIGVLTTIILMVAWSVNLVTKHLATYFGGAIVLLGMGIALPHKSGWYREQFFKIPFMARHAQRTISKVDRASEEFDELVSLRSAEALLPLYSSHTMVATLGKNPRLIDEAIARERGLGGNAIYVVFVEERPGLFVGDDVERPYDKGLDALRFAVAEALRMNFIAIPVWTVSYDAAEGIARAAEVLKVDTVMVGAGQRSRLYHIFRGHVLKGLVRRLPANCRLLIFA